jgi:ATP/ADP translocase
MTFMHNKLCNKQDGLFSSSRSYLHKGQDHEMSFKRHINHLISSNHVCFMATFSFFYHILQCQQQF